MPQPLVQFLTIDDPSKDSYFFDISNAVAPTIQLDVGSSVFNGQALTVVFKQGTLDTTIGAVTYGASVQFDSGYVPTISQTPGAFLIITGVVVGGVLHAIASDLSALVSVAGDTMTGDLTLSGDPTSPLHAATKAYVDANAGGGGTSYHPITGSRYGSVAGNPAAFVGFGVQPGGLTTRMSVTEYENAPIFRLGWPVPYDMYSGQFSAPTALSYEMYVSEATHGDPFAPPVAYVVFRESENTAYTFVNPYCVEVSNNSVGAGIPVGIHIAGADNNLVSIKQATSTPPAWICRFLDAGVSPSANVGLLTGTLYPMTLEFINSPNSGIGQLNGVSLDPGAGYTTPGTYTNVPLTTTGSGVGATATIDVSSGQVNLVSLTNPGTGYSPGDTLSAAASNLGGRVGGADFTILVGSTLPTTVVVNADGDIVTTFDSLVAHLNDQFATLNVNVRCAWSFGNALVFVHGDDSYFQTASYMRVTDAYTADSLFSTISVNFPLGFIEADVPASGPQSVEPTNSTYDSVAADLVWTIPVVASSPLNGYMPG